MNMSSDRDAWRGADPFFNGQLGGVLKKSFTGLLPVGETSEIRIQV